MFHIINTIRLYLPSNNDLDMEYKQNFLRSIYPHTQCTSSYYSNCCTQFHIIYTNLYHLIHISTCTWYIFYHILRMPYHYMVCKIYLFLMRTQYSTISTHHHHIEGNFLCTKSKWKCLLLNGTLRCNENIWAFNHLFARIIHNF